MTPEPSTDPFDPADVTWATVSPRLATARRVVGIVVIVLGAAVGAAIASRAGGPWPLVPAGAAVVAVPWCWTVIGRQVRAIGWAERDEELLVRRGVLWRTIVVVPYARLQYVDVEVGPLDRRLGIARVQLHTASASTDASIPGLTPEEAAHLRDRLTERGRSQLAGL